ncbi:MAG: peptidase [Nitrospira sp.]|nr:peptidase [Nitrospira sp.]MCE3224750.1 peptidase [Nitrospira sp.]
MIAIVRWVVTLLMITSLAIIQAAALVTNSIAQPSSSTIRHKLPTQTVPATPRIAQGEIIVKYRDVDLPPKRSSARTALLKKLGGRLSSLYGVTVLRTYPMMRSQRFRVPPGKPVEYLIKTLQENHPDIIERVTPNRVTAHIVVHQSPIPPSAFPNDRQWQSGELWGMVKIGMAASWPLMQNVGGDIIVAVIDTGIDYYHLDFVRLNSQLNVWNNPTETPNGQDDDLNDLIDDIHGPNYCNNGFAEGDPDDDHGHGTMVAGVIGAIGNNSIGDNSRDVAGIYWRTKIMAVKSFCSSGQPESNLDVAQGIYYAVDNGATVINNSYSLGNDDDQDVREAVQYANQHNVLFVAAAGNSNSSNNTIPSYPANYAFSPYAFSNVITVGASNCTDGKWTESGSYGSNYSQTKVHLAAPGEDITSTYPPHLGPNPSVASGTSMAAAHVSGCAALLQAKEGTSVLPSVLKDRLMGTANDPAGLKSYVVNGNRLNCYRAIMNERNPTDTTSPAAPNNLMVR